MSGQRGREEKTPLLALEGFGVAYGPIQAVVGVSASVQQGEIITLLGANGAGKSSLLKGICGLAPVVGGNVLFKQADITGLPPEEVVARGIALAPEGRRLFARLTVGDNLRLGGALQRDKERLEAARERVFALFPALRERLHQVSGTLSGGQQQMVAIGRALMGDPQLLLLDEPSLGLAPMLVDEIFALLTRLRDQGTTILLVEQNVHRALEIADRAYVLANGRIQVEGRASDLRASAEIERAYLAIGVED